LSKEYAITLLLVLPAAAFTLRNYKTAAALKSIWVPAVVFLLYALIRAKIVGWSATEQTDPLNNPYIYATGIEKFATKIYILLKYILLLVKPFPLSADYSYAQIQFRTFADWDVWVSAALNISLIYYTIRSVLKRKLIGLLGVIYLSNLFLISNFLFNIGASMGERFLFHSSFAFCVAVSLGLDLLKTKMKIQVFNFVVIIFLAGISVVSFLVIIPRNRDWKNSYTLFLKDVQTSPNSALCNANATSALVNLALVPENSLQKDSLLKKAIAHSNKAISIHPGFSNAFFNRAVCDYHLANYDSAFVYWEKGFALFNSAPHKTHFSELVYKKALTEGEQKHFDTAIKLLEWSVKISPGNAAWWSDLGGAYFSVNRLQDAKSCWEKALSIDPNEIQASKALPFINQKLLETAN
ncbi:MAG: tetratricopeptide repeat protein, partial [Bacteroidia bacterium]|nr:tetratricopeptide repeat protein [Bacteroidia bacterium]